MNCGEGIEPKLEQLQSYIHWYNSGKISPLTRRLREIEYEKSKGLRDMNNYG